MKLEVGARALRRLVLTWQFSSAARPRKRTHERAAPPGTSFGMGLDRSPPQALKAGALSLADGGEAGRSATPPLDTTLTGSRHPTPAIDTEPADSECLQGAERKLRGRSAKANTWNMLKSDSDGNIRNFLTPSRTADNLLTGPEKNVQQQNQQQNQHQKEQPQKDEPCKKRKFSTSITEADSGDDEGQFESSPLPPAPQPDIGGMLSAIMAKLDSQSDKLDTQAQELAAIRASQADQNKKIEEVKRQHMELATRTSTLEQEFAEFKASTPNGYNTDPALVNRMEQFEREKKRTSIVIRGLNPNVGEVLENTRAFIQDRFREGASVRDAFLIDSRQTIMAQLDTVSATESILATKSRALGNSGIFIDKAMTNKERYVAYKVRERARMEINRGSAITQGRNKIRINEQWFFWDDATDDFVTRSTPNQVRHAPSHDPNPFTTNDNQKTAYNQQQKPQHIHSAHPHQGSFTAEARSLPHSGNTLNVFSKNDRGGARGLQDQRRYQQQRAAPGASGSYTGTYMD